LDITVKNDATVQFMLEEIKNRLKMATMAAIKPDHFNTDHYEDVLELYEFVTSKTTFSITEMEAIVDELGRIKK
jgi:uncharacterized protein YfkK (UPF0435 family)